MGTCYTCGKTSITSQSGNYSRCARAPSEKLLNTLPGEPGGQHEGYANINGTLEERGKRYGNFTEHAKITQDIKRAMASAPKYHALADYQKEALEMFAHKIGRILNGDPDYHDSWHDLVGYAKLVADRLEH